MAKDGENDAIVVIPCKLNVNASRAGATLLDMI
jgi:hypothetical protein